MPTPFPGMDPYLERPDLWPDVHNRLVVLLADDLAPRLRPRYYVSIEERTYSVGMGELVFAGRGDVAVVGPSSLDSQQVEDMATGPEVVLVELPVPDEIRETYLEVRSVATDRVITLLEILSPTNKRGGEGREMYLRKRLHVAGTLTHLVEIDLLRSGESMPMRGAYLQGDYRLLISRGERRPQADLLNFSVRQPIPGFKLPLQLGDEEPQVDLNRLLHDLYDRAGYDLRIDYRDEPDPPFEGDNRQWADELLHKAGLR